MEDVTPLSEEYQKMVERYGPWTLHNLHVGSGIDTVRSGIRWRARGLMVKRLIQLIGDVSSKPFHQLSILDLGCFEGWFAIECALQGAEAVGVDVQEAAIEKAEFARRALGLERVRFIRDDVRELSLGRDGEFDVVLCLGLLYHLDAPSVFRLLEQIFRVCRGFAIFETQVAAWPDRLAPWGDRWVRGWRFRRSPQAEPPDGFWMGDSDLRNVLYRIGFTSVLEYLIPGDIAEQQVDRVTLVALKGQPRELRSSPAVNEFPEADPRAAVLRDERPQGLGPRQTLAWGVQHLCRRWLGIEVRRTPLWARQLRLRRSSRRSLPLA